MHMDANTPLTWGLFEAHMHKFQEYLGGRFDSLEGQIGDLAFATKTGFDDMDRQFHEVRQDISEMKQDITVLKQDVSVLKADVTVLKQDVTVLKQDVSVLKQDVTILKQDVTVLKTDMKDCKQYIQSSSIESSSNRVRLQNLEARIA